MPARSFWYFRVVGQISTTTAPSGAAKLEAMNMIDTAHTHRRWATRKEAIAYARVGTTTMNELMKAGRVHAKKLDGKKVLVDLNSIDALYSALPSVGAVR
jgi:hypothetical protein